MYLAAYNSKGTKRDTHIKLTQICQGWLLGLCFYPQFLQQNFTPLRNVTSFSVWWGFSPVFCCLYIYLLCWPYFNKALKHICKFIPSTNICDCVLTCKHILMLLFLQWTVSTCWGAVVEQRSSEGTVCLSERLKSGPYLGFKK